MIEKYTTHFGAVFQVDGGARYHTYRTWGLFPDGDHWPDFPAAEPKAEYTDIPGTNGVLDRSEELTGYLTFKNRKATLLYTLTEPDKWEDMYTLVKQRLHGRMCRIIRDADPAYYYHGRVTVPTLAIDKMRGTLTITADLEPYKYTLTTSAEPWLWDTLSFVNGVIRTIYTGREVRDVDVRGTDTVLNAHGDPVYLLKNVPYNAGGGEYIVLNNETKTVTLWSSPMGGTATVSYQGDITVTAEGVAVHLEAETLTTAELVEIELPHAVEAVTATLSGTGRILIAYQAGYL